MANAMTRVQIAKSDNPPRQRRFCQMQPSVRASACRKDTPFGCRGAAAAADRDWGDSAGWGVGVSHDDDDRQSVIARDTGCQ